MPHGHSRRCGWQFRWCPHMVDNNEKGAIILTGYGFTGYDLSGESLWEGAANVRFLNIEFPPNFKVVLDSWNISTNVWLRECVYKRVTPKGKKPGFKSSVLTSLTSAFWVSACPP